MAAIEFALNFQINHYYLHHPKSRVNISQETRINGTSEEIKKWKVELSKFKPNKKLASSRLSKI